MGINSSESVALGREFPLKSFRLSRVLLYLMCSNAARKFRGTSCKAAFCWLVGLSLFQIPSEDDDCKGYCAHILQRSFVGMATTISQLLQYALEVDFLKKMLVVVSQEWYTAAILFSTRFECQTQEYVTHGYDKIQVASPFWTKFRDRGDFLWSSCSCCLQQ